LRKGGALTAGVNVDAMQKDAQTARGRSIASELSAAEVHFKLDSWATQFLRF
jgi:hypothetical protein